MEVFRHIPSGKYSIFARWWDAQKAKFYQILLKCFHLRLCHVWFCTTVKTGNRHNKNADKELEQARTESYQAYMDVVKLSIQNRLI
jgi:hypothetical protein